MDFLPMSFVFSCLCRDGYILPKEDRHHLLSFQCSKIILTIQSPYLDLWSFSLSVLLNGHEFWSCWHFLDFRYSFPLFEHNGWKEMSWPQDFMEQFLLLILYPKSTQILHITCVCRNMCSEISSNPRQTSKVMQGQTFGI
jgi:hypothetical protein